MYEMTSAPSHDGGPRRRETPSGSNFDFRLPLPSSPSRLLKFPIMETQFYSLITLGDSFVAKNICLGQNKTLIQTKERKKPLLSVKLIYILYIYKLWRADTIISAMQVALSYNLLLSYQINT